VWPSNVRVLMTYLSLFIGYQFDDSDWLAIELALPDTDAAAPDGSYEYPLVGRPQLVVRLARNAGADPVAVTVTGPMDPVLEARVDTLIAVLAEVADNRQT
jgi:hypothetical protein